MKFDFSRFKNYGLWVSIASLVLIILQALGVPVVPAQFETVVNAFLALLVALGIVSNPNTDNKGFGDDKDEEVPVEDNKGDDTESQL